MSDSFLLQKCFTSFSTMISACPPHHTLHWASRPVLTVYLGTHLTRSDSAKTHNVQTPVQPSYRQTDQPTSILGKQLLRLEAHFPTG
jgi:hypothetical protein